MIDYKTLRPGSHILVDGERHEVYGLSPKGITIRYDADPILGCAMLTEKAKIEPIPLTAELLQELGFEHRPSDDWMKRFEDNEHIFVDISQQYALVCIFPHDNKEHFEVCIPSYLHSLENIVYPTIGKELVE